MAKADSSMPSGGDHLRSAEVADETVSQVGRAAFVLMELRQSLMGNLQAAQTNEERQSLAAEVELDANFAVTRQGLTIEEFNEVMTAAPSDPDLEARVLDAYQHAGAARGLRS